MPSSSVIDGVYTIRMACVVFRTHLDTIDLNELGDLARKQEILRQKIGTTAKQILA